MGKTIHFTWMRAHINIMEHVDHLARSACFFSNVTWTKRPYQETLPRTRKKIKEQWKLQLQNNLNQLSFSFAQYYSHLPHGSWFNDINLPRQYIVTFTRMRCGHVKLRSHLHKIGLESSPTCKCNEADETLYHVLQDCNLYAYHRTLLYDVLYNTDINKPISAYNLLFNPSKQIILIITKFFKNTRIAL